MIGWLAKGFYATSPVLSLPIVALVIFLSVFTLVIFRTFRMKDNAVDELAALPLGLETPKVTNSNNGEHSHV